MRLVLPAQVSFVVCIRNDGFPASLEVRKIYPVIADAAAESLGYLRVLDESGEDYLYPAAFFMPIALPQSIRDALQLATDQGE